MFRPEGPMSPKKAFSRTLFGRRPKNPDRPKFDQNGLIAIKKTHFGRIGRPGYKNRRMRFLAVARSKNRKNDKKGPFLPKRASIPQVTSRSEQEKPFLPKKGLFGQKGLLSRTRSVHLRKRGWFCPKTPKPPRSLKLMRPKTSLSPSKMGELSEKEKSHPRLTPQILEPPSKKRGEKWPKNRPFYQSLSLKFGQI